MTPVRRHSTLLIDDKPLQVLPELACHIGDRSAIALQQLHFLLRGVAEREADADRATSRHYQDGRWWVWNSYEEWQERQFPFWSTDTVSRIFRHLEDEGLIITGNYNRRTGDQTKWYSINYEAVERLLSSTPSRKNPRALRKNPQATPQFAVGNTAEYDGQPGSLQGALPETPSETPAETLAEEEAPPPPLPGVDELIGWPAATLRAALPATPEDTPTYQALLTALAWVSFRHTLKQHDSPTLLDRIAGDVEEAFAAGRWLTVAGLDYAVHQSRGRDQTNRVLWPFLMRVWRDNPSGPPPDRPARRDGLRPLGPPAVIVPPLAPALPTPEPDPEPEPEPAPPPAPTSAHVAATVAYWVQQLDEVPVTPGQLARAQQLWQASGVEEGAFVYRLQTTGATALRLPKRPGQPRAKAWLDSLAAHLATAPPDEDL